MKVKIETVGIFREFFGEKLAKMFFNCEELQFFEEPTRANTHNH
jgi:hypothetical protein